MKLLELSKTRNHSLHCRIAVAETDTILKQITHSQAVAKYLGPCALMPVSTVQYRHNEAIRENDYPKWAKLILEQRLQFIER
jgi:hypothetical protein